MTRGGGIYPQTHRLRDQEQTYTDTGEPILSGDKIRFQQAAGGHLVPSEPVEGVASYFAGAMAPGTLFLKLTDESGNDRFYYITSGTITKVED